MRKQASTPVQRHAIPRSIDKPRQIFSRKRGKSLRPRPHLLAVRQLLRAARTSVFTTKARTTPWRVLVNAPSKKSHLSSESRDSRHPETNTHTHEDSVPHTRSLDAEREPRTESKHNTRHSQKRESERDENDATEHDIEAVLQSDDGTAALFLKLLTHPADIAEALRYVDIDEWPRLLRLIDDESMRAETLALFEEGERNKLLPLLKPQEIGALLVQLDSDDAADVVEELDAKEQAQALASLPAEDRASIERLLAYPPDSAGGIMQVECAKVRVNETVIDAIGKVRTLVEDEIQVDRVYVIDESDVLLGMVQPINLLLAKQNRPIHELMEEPIVTVLPDVDQEHVASLFKKYALDTLPVVDKSRRLLGRILVDDIVDVLQEEADEDALRAGGTDAEELLYQNEVFPIAKVRLPWLIITLLGSMVSASLLHLYEDVVIQAIIVSSFVPVITAMGGNVGTQSATILTRGLATGRIELADVPTVFFREFRVGILMGVICGVGVGIISTIFFGRGNWYLGLVVFLAMLCAMTVAASVGTTAPAAMKKFGVDPAIASGPFVTTANDIIGIIIYMSTAMMFLDKLK